MRPAAAGPTLPKPPRRFTGSAREPPGNAAAVPAGRRAPPAVPWWACLLLEHPHEGVQRAAGLLRHLAAGGRLVDDVRQGLGDVVRDLVLRHARLLRYLLQLLRVDRVLDF